MNEIIKQNDGYVLNDKMDWELCMVLAQLDSLKKKEAELKQMLLNEMELRGIKKIENEEYSITYIEPTTREDFDKKKLKNDNPDLYDTYIRIVPVKSSVRVRLKI